MRKSILIRTQRCLAIVSILLFAVSCVPTQVRLPSKDTGLALKGYSRLELKPGKRRTVWKSTGIDLLPGDKGIIFMVHPEFAYLRA
jgi:hypothetical protein